MNLNRAFSTGWSFVFFIFTLMLLFPLPIAASDSPDLIITSISASPSIIAPGDPLTIRGSVKNQGDGDAGYFRTVMYLSSDPVITTSDVRIGSPKGNETESLKAGETETFTYRTNLISTAAGIYYPLSRTIEIKSRNQMRKTIPAREAKYSLRGANLLHPERAIPWS
jgi:hypothetical protein